MSHIFGSENFVGRCASTMLALAILAAGGWGESTAHAQPLRPDSVGGLHPVLPVTPERMPRPLEGPAPGEQLQLGPEAPPVGAFLDSLRGNDAALEIIVGQGRLLTFKSDIASREGTAVIAVGDPTVLDFEVLPNPRMLRILGRQTGVTDLSITTADGETHAFEVHVVYDLTLLRAQLKQVFPDAHLRLGQIREHLVVEGQARNSAQVAQILATIRAFLTSAQVSRRLRNERTALTPEELDPRAAPARRAAPRTPPNAGRLPGEQLPEASEELPPVTLGETGGRPDVESQLPPPQIINLIRVPGVQQVLLKVRIAELNRTALREVGADILTGSDGGAVGGTQIGGATVSALGTAGPGGVITNRAATFLGTSQNSTAFGIFPDADIAFVIRALRDNSLLRILAEPNLVTLSGHRASFLAGGEFPIPVPQAGLGGGTTVTIEFREFGVQLDFLPFVVDEDRIRISVTPEVSNVDFGLAATLVQGGTPVPGINTRRAATTVELRQGQTLAIAGLLQVEIAGDTSRIPGLGDLPYLGPFFSNTSHRRVEKELLVLVTPYLVTPLEADQVGPLPGEEVQDPNDAEFYMLNRIEGRTGRPARPTVEYEFLGPKGLIEYERHHLHGPVGFSKPALAPVMGPEPAPGYRYGAKGRSSPSNPVKKR